MTLSTKLPNTCHFDYYTTPSTRYLELNEDHLILKSTSSPERFCLIKASLNKKAFRSEEKTSITALSRLREEFAFDTIETHFPLMHAIQFKHHSEVVVLDTKKVFTSLQAFILFLFPSVSKAFIDSSRSKPLPLQLPPSPSLFLPINNIPQPIPAQIFPRKESSSSPTPSEAASPPSVLSEGDDDLTEIDTPPSFPTSLSNRVSETHSYFTSTTPMPLLNILKAALESSETPPLTPPLKKRKLSLDSPSTRENSPCYKKD